MKQRRLIAVSLFMLAVALFATAGATEQIQLAACGTRSPSAVSNSVTSTCWPRPERVRSVSASRMPMMAFRPEAMSTIGMPWRTGPDSSVPLTAISPQNAWPIAS